MTQKEARKRKAKKKKKRTRITTTKNLTEALTYQNLI